jgi:hypothetical protein
LHYSSAASAGAAAELCLSDLSGFFLATLRTAQEFRSKAMAHRKGSDYQKLFKKLGVADKTRLGITDGYLSKLADGFRQLSAKL